MTFMSWLKVTVMWHYCILRISRTICKAKSSDPHFCKLVMQYIQCCIQGHWDQDKKLSGVVTDDVREKQAVGTPKHEIDVAIP